MNRRSFLQRLAGGAALLAAGVLTRDTHAIERALGSKDSPTENAPVSLKDIEREYTEFWQGGDRFRSVAVTASAGGGRVADLYADKIKMAYMRTAAEMEQAMFATSPELRYAAREREREWDRMQRRAGRRACYGYGEDPSIWIDLDSFRTVGPHPALLPNMDARVRRGLLVTRVADVAEEGAAYAWS